MRNIARAKKLFACFIYWSVVIKIFIKALQELSQSYKLPEGMHDAALELDKAYIPTRYPDAHPSGSPKSRYTAHEAGRLIAYAQKIIEFCAGLLS